MGTTLLVSPRAAQRLAIAKEWLQARDADEELLVVGPTSLSVGDLLRRIVTERRAIFGWHRTTLSGMAAELAVPLLAERGLTSISSVAAEALVTRVVHELRDDLSRYASILDAPGFAIAVSRTVRELRMEAVDCERVEAVDRELAAVLRAYEERLSAAGLTDRAGLFALAAEATEEQAQRHCFLGLPLLLLDVPSETAVESVLLARVAREAPEALATTPEGDERSLRSLEEALGCQSMPVPVDGDDGLRRLQQRLFSGETGDEVPADDAVTILSAPGESRECVEIARHILEEAAAGTPFDDIGILLRSPDEYRAHLELALARARVPAHFARGVVRPDPSGRAFLSLLRCAIEGLSARRFSEYLSIGEVPQPEQGEPPVAPSAERRWVPPDAEAVPGRIAETVSEIGASANDSDEDPPPPGSDPGSAPVIDGTLRSPRRWERLLVEAAVIGGLERWRRRLDGLERELAVRLEEVTSDDPDSPLAVIQRRDLADLQALRTFALPLLEELDRLPTEATWSDWLDGLTGLAMRALRRPERVLALLGELAPMGPIGSVGLPEVRRVLSAHLLELRMAPRDRRYGRVFVGPIDTSRGLSLKVVFIPGLAERLFPQKIGQDPILLDSGRGAVDTKLLTNAGRIASERRGLHLAVGTAVRRVVLSYPRIDLDQSRPRVPSFYALESMRAAEGRLPLFEDLAARAETVAEAHIGWPAPSEPSAAIDDAEYDLALLRPLHELPEEETLGRAHYLLTANAHLGRALRFRARRWLRRWTPADGLVVSNDGAREALVRHDPSNRSFSPTALQNLAACPYKFYLYTILKLAPRQTAEAIDELAPLQKGSLVHDVQFRLLGEFERQRLLPVRSENLDACRTILDRVLDEVATRYHEELAPAIETVWQDSLALIRSDLREWLRRLAEDSSGFVPWRFELAFGLPGREHCDPHSVDDPVSLDCGLQLRGSIDLVEQKTPNTLRVTDHKTGKVAVKPGSVIEGGTTLQPIMYPLVTEKLFPDATVESARLSYCTTTGGFTEHEVPLDERAREAARLVANTVKQVIDGGFLPALPTEKGCRWCDYRVVCGPNEERRTARKPPEDRLAGLLELRIHP